jgi:hypothetical protein
MVFLALGVSSARHRFDRRDNLEGRNGPTFRIEGVRICGYGSECIFAPYNAAANLAHREPGIGYDAVDGPFFAKRGLDSRLMSR